MPQGASAEEPVTDEERIAKSHRVGHKMYGPTERQRCGKHPTRWETYRWVWPVGASPEVGDAQYARSCTVCMKEETP